MKRNYLLLIFVLVFLAVLSGKLTAGMSFVGRLGIGFFYKQFSFLKTWWQTALIYFGSMILVGILLYLIDKLLDGRKRKLILLSLFLLSLAGLYFTYHDFRTNLTYRWLGERFHLGIYLYWIGWCIISLFFALTPKKQVVEAAPPTNE